MQKKFLYIFVGTAIFFIFSAYLKKGNSNLRPSVSVETNNQVKSNFETTATSPPQIKSSPTVNSSQINTATPETEFHSRIIPQHPRREPSQNRYPKMDELFSHQILNDSKWLIWKNVTAVPKKNFDGNEANLLGKASGFVFLYDNNQKYNIDSFHPDRPLVLYNSRLRQTGVLTGTIKVQLRDENSIQEFLRDHQAVTLGEFPEIKTYFVVSQSLPFPLHEFYRSIQNDERVHKSELEILSRQYEK